MMRNLRENEHPPDHPSADESSHFLSRHEQDCDLPLTSKMTRMPTGVIRSSGCSSSGRTKLSKIFVPLSAVKRCGTLPKNVRTGPELKFRECRCCAGSDPFRGDLCPA
jgi:hypothetical protein